MHSSTAASISSTVDSNPAQLVILQSPTTTAPERVACRRARHYRTQFNTYTHAPCAVLFLSLPQRHPFDTRDYRHALQGLNVLVEFSTNFPVSAHHPVISPTLQRCVRCERSAGAANDHPSPSSSSSSSDLHPPHKSSSLHLTLTIFTLSRSVARQP